MKLLYITEDRYPPYRADVAELFGRQMPKYSHGIDWVMPKGEGHEDKSDQVEWLGQRIYLLPRVNNKGVLSKIANQLLSFRSYLKLIPLAKKNQYDIIQVRDLYFASLCAMVAARLSGAKFCFWISFPFPDMKIYRAKTGLTKHRTALFIKGYVNWLLLYKIIIPFSDHTFVQSDQMKKDMVAKGINEKKMTAVPMGVTTSMLVNSDEVPPPNNKSPVLIYLGSLDKARRVDFLIRVTARVKRTYDNVRLLIIGGGEDEEDVAIIKREVGKLKMEASVEMTGLLPKDAALQHVRGADICFSPIYPIPMYQCASPTKLVEYMAMAKVIVANDHPDQTVVMQKSGVGATVPWDEESFAEAVVAILGDPDKAKAMADKGPDYVKKYRTYDVIAKQVDDAYKRVLAT